MSFLSDSFLGVHVWIWLYALLSFVVGTGIIIYINRKKINETYIKWRWPEQVIKIVMHYKGGIYDTFWRLIPTDKSFDIDGKTYYFKEQSLIKGNDVIANTIDKDNPFVTIEHKVTDASSGKPKEIIKTSRYNLKGVPIRKKGSIFPEIHYKFNNPNPIDYDVTNDKIVFSAVDMKDFKENDLFKKLLTLSEERSMMIFLLVLGGINLIISLFILATIKGWIK